VIGPHKALLRCALEKNTRRARVGGAEGAPADEAPRNHVVPKCRCPFQDSSRYLEPRFAEKRMDVARPILRQFAFPAKLVVFRQRTCRNLRIFMAPRKHVSAFRRIGAAAEARSLFGADKNGAGDEPRPKFGCLGQSWRFCFFGPSRRVIRAKRRQIGGLYYRSSTLLHVRRQTTDATPTKARVSGF
jgi:hypothetical protein